MITASMTLPELVAAAESYKNGGLKLTAEERDYLITLLKAYAEELLNNGQSVDLGAVTIAKMITGEVFVKC